MNTGAMIKSSNICCRLSSLPPVFFVRLGEPDGDEAIHTTLYSHDMFFLLSKLTGPIIGSQQEVLALIIFKSTLFNFHFFILTDGFG